MFGVIDTPTEATTVEKPVNKRQASKDALRKGKGHLVPKKCSVGFVDKAPDEAI